MLIDSHCHLDKLDLTPYQNDFSNFMQEADKNQIEHMLCISIDLEAYPAMCELVAPYPQISLSVGVHPNVDVGQDPSTAELIALADNEKVVAIGETGLDYFRSEGDLSWQHKRLENHIAASKETKKPLIIHTREAAADTLRILKEQGADEVGGVIHCFTEDWDFAQQAMDLNFYISFSGIVTFKNAKEIQEVAKKVPTDRYLIETDSPYLAPVPFRGKSNYPIYVQHVAQYIADLRETDYATIVQQSNDNFRRLFSV
ncbi:MAG: TatD family hydrolase [Gammaproteobacteria bacterium]|jgi:TatD DNase family protein|nr:TatD family hydrolase [Gammaproteobacteria bacterium]MBT5221757.1 TatD family hydrolase [Gammaproteobacteria bacterium]MBT5826459.1 TatD family hydrolase [Gammaproteobacteria bacterium]MBT5967628.1 TatD family hydrolase [Gammaproteobacteria bacterium]MBT6418767.1 TatD family hydrolase [Gammaproteobacteria bacterium]